MIGFFKLKVTKRSLEYVTVNSEVLCTRLWVILTLDGLQYKPPEVADGFLKFMWTAVCLKSVS